MGLTVTLFVMYLACVCFQRRKALSGRSLLERGFSAFQQSNTARVRGRLALACRRLAKPCLWAGVLRLLANVSLSEPYQTAFPLSRSAC